MSETATHPSALAIARVLLGKATPEEARAAEEHAACCERCGAELRQARAASGRFHGQVFARTLPEVERRLAHAPRRRLWLATLAMATAAALVLVVPKLRPQADEPAYGTKGGVVLQIFGRRGDRALTVQDGARLRAGDQLRFAVQTGGARFVLIGSADGRGQATVYYPSAPLGQDGGVVELLPESIVLDDAPGPERIFAVFSDRPLDAAMVKQALSTVAMGGAATIRNARHLDLPYAQATVLLEKERAPGEPR
jgi:hypothetical protein